MLLEINYWVGPGGPGAGGREQPGEAGGGRGGGKATAPDKVEP